MASLPIKELMDAVVTELRGATTTHLNDSSLKVYKGDQPAWRYRKGIFVVWAGGSQEPASIQGQWDDINEIWVIVRQEIRDSSGAVNPDAWYDDFLELCEEIIVELSLVANRRLTGAGGSTSHKTELTDWNPGYDTEGTTEMQVCQFILRIYGPRDDP